MQYRKKPVVIEAVQVQFCEMLASGPEPGLFKERPDWLIDGFEAGVLALSTRGARDYAVIEVKTLEGTMEALPNDYIIRGVKGELYPCKPDIFAATYEPVEG